MAKILLVEDDNNLREIYEARLQAEGYTIVSAQDGEEALVVAKKEKPDLIISDVMMPRISGFEMLDILRNTEGLKDVKVIMLTALGQAEDKTRADSLGADRYLVKSQVTLEDIVKAAQELLGGGSAPSTVPPATPPSDDTTPPAAPPNGPSATTSSTAGGAAMTSTPPPAAPPSPTPTPVIPPEPPKPASSAITPSTPTTTPTSPAPVAPPASAPEPPATTPTPAPEPPAEPPQPAANAQAPAAQSASDEESAIKSQIESFVNQNSQTAPKAAEPSDESIMADAIKDLVSGTEGAQPQAKPESKVVEPPAPPTPPSAAPAVTPPAAPAPTKREDDGVPIAHKKVIKPISDMTETAPNLNDLLAKEGITSLDNDDTHPASPTNPASVVSPGNAPPPAQASAVSGLPTTPHPPGHVISPSNNSGVDPNSIAL